MGNVTVCPGWTRPEMGEGGSGEWKKEERPQGFSVTGRKSTTRFVREWSPELDPYDKDG